MAGSWPTPPSRWSASAHRLGLSLARLNTVELWPRIPGMNHLAALLTLIAFILVAALHVPRNHPCHAFEAPDDAGRQDLAFAHLIANNTLADLCSSAASSGPSSSSAPRAVVTSPRRQRAMRRARCSPSWPVPPLWAPWPSGCIGCGSATSRWADRRYFHGGGPVCPCSSARLNIASDQETPATHRPHRARR